MKGSVIGTLLAAAVCLSGCEDQARKAAIITGGDVERGRDAIRMRGCGSCHEIPGVPAAKGLVGPSLDRFAMRTHIAGQVLNRPDNLMKWIQKPHEIEAGTAMPDTGVTEAEARDIATYLYTLD